MGRACIFKFEIHRVLNKNLILELVADLGVGDVPLSLKFTRLYKLTFSSGFGCKSFN